MIPQVIFLVLMFIGLGVVLAKHGEPQSNYNAVTAIISVFIQIVLLYWGGFFNVFFK